MTVSAPDGKYFRASRIMILTYTDAPRLVTSRSCVELGCVLYHFSDYSSTFSLFILHGGSGLVFGTFRVVVAALYI